MVSPCPRCSAPVDLVIDVWTPCPRCGTSFAIVVKVPDVRHPTAKPGQCGVELPGGWLCVRNVGHPGEHKRVFDLSAAELELEIAATGNREITQ